MVDSSPRPIAASHVLHRLLVPRHPPSALGNLTTKMLASTVQFSNNDQPQTPPPPHTHHSGQFDDQDQEGTRTNNHTSRHACFFRTQQGVFTPTTSRTPPHFHTTHPKAGAVLQGFGAVAGAGSPVSPPMSTPHRHPRQAGSCSPLQAQALLRKEVIQPHLPVRLPCYDFVPIASPTFDGSLPKGLGHRLRVLPTFVT